MSEIKRVDILEQRFNNGVLTEIEQDELLELLEKDGRLEYWLDNNVQLTPPLDVVYEDKDLLKSIAEPIVELEPDMSIVYQNKEALRKKGIVFHLTRCAKVAVAAVIMLFVSDMLLQPEINSIDNEIALKSSYVEIEHQYIAIEPVLVSWSIEDYTSNEELSRIFDMSSDEIEIKIKEIAVSVICDEILELIPTEMVVKESEEIVLFAQAEQWEQVDDPYHDEIVITEAEEWQTSETEPRNKIQGVFKRIKKRVRQL